MDLTKLAQALGLPKESPTDKVFAAAAQAVLEGTRAKESLSKVGEELGSYGLKLDQGRVVKLETGAGQAEALDLSVKQGDDDQTVRLKKELADARKRDQLSRIATNAKDIDRLVKEGKLPPAAATALSKLKNMREKVEVLALSSDGKEIVSTVEDLPKILTEFLSSLPRMTLPGQLRVLPPAEALSQVGKIYGENEKKDPEALEAKGKEIAARNSRSSKSFKEKRATAAK